MSSSTRLDVATLRSDFKKAASDKKITREEVQKIIKRARRGQLHESEARTFKREAQLYKDLFKPDAAKEVNDFVANRMKKIEMLDPGPREIKGEPRVVKLDKNRLEFKDIKNAELFRHGISVRDAEQNYIGDCYLMGAMSSVAYATPEVIRDAFTRNEDGTYTVQLYDLKGKPHFVNIDARLPVNGWYGYYYARSHDPKELWPALLEKAVAKWKGSYGAIEGGVPGDAMTWLTGKKSADIMMRARGVTEDTVFEALKKAIKEKKPVIAATFGESSAKMYKGTGMYEDHTYSVLAVRVNEKGEKVVKLRNPWGSSEPAGNGRDDGIFELPLSKLMKLFSNVSING